MMPLGEILSNITVDHVRGDYGERNGNPLQYSCLENPMGEELVELQYMWSQCIGHTQRLNKQEEIQFSYSVMSDSLRPHKSQHARPTCPSPTSGVHSNSHPSSRWCHPAISSSFIPFSSCPQSLPASETFPMSQLFVWGGPSIGVQL